MKLASSLSYRVATWRNCLSFEKIDDVALFVEIDVVTLIFSVRFRGTRTVACTWTTLLR
jgi:hypothetical protein